MSEQQTQSTTAFDLVIIGGGIGGLWLLNRACNAGYNAILFEQEALGNEQTIASQGMIHGGIKYALSGALSGSSEAIADMPDHWRRCLRGEGDVDLRTADVLSEHFYFWSSQSIGSRMTSFFASKFTRCRVDKIKKEQRPAIFDDPLFKGSLYKSIDIVLDVPSVLSSLYGNYADRIFKIDWSESKLVRNQSTGRLDGLKIGDNTISANHFVFSAGKGNQGLMGAIAVEKPEMQIRPLQQVIFTHDCHLPIYAHCLGANPSPRLTISSHKTESGKTAWYLGGDLATEGVNDSPEQLIAKAKAEIAELFPWIDFGETAWSTLPVDRAEPKQKGLIKPDKAFAAKAEGCENLIVAWPTKLTLAPNMADEVLALLPASTGKECSKTIMPEILQNLTKPTIAKAHW